MDALHLTDASRILAGVVLLTVPTIEIGGWFMTRIVRGLVPMTPFQKAFARAGHAHAGVLVILSLVCLLYADAAGLTGRSAGSRASGSRPRRSCCRAASSRPPRAAATSTARTGCSRWCGPGPPRSP